VAIILALLSACGVGEEPTPTEMVTEAPMVMPTPSPTPTPTPTPTQSPSPTPEPTPDISPISDQDFSEAGVYVIEKDTIYSIDLYNDGTLDTFEIHNYYESECQIEAESKIFINGDVFEAEEITLYWAGECSFMRRDNGNAAIIITMYGGNDYRNTWIYSFEDGKPKNVPIEHDAYATEFFYFSYKDLTKETIQFCGARWMFAVLRITIDATWNDDFTLNYNNDGWFDVVECVTKGLTTKIDLSAERKIGDEYIADTLKAGTSFLPTQVRDNQVKIECTDGSQWILTFEKGGENGYGWTINGIDDINRVIDA
jgi:hypothetical protein